MRLPPILPNSRIAKSDRDDFITNLLTVLEINPLIYYPDLPASTPTPPPLSDPVADREPVATLAEVKLHCRVELDQTDEDSELMLLERAAHLHTENVLRRQGQLDADAPENIKTAVLILVAHWYRNREAVVAGRIEVIPFTYNALISTEKNYAGFY